jgi:hypothetical protein
MPPTMRTTIVLLAILLFVPALKAQETAGRYYLSAEVGGGYTRLLTDVDVDGLDRNGFEGMFRLMWNPEHLLSLGLETGYLHLYSIERGNIPTEFGPTDFTASMTAVPINFALAMRVTDEIKIRGGSGMYLLSNSGEIFGETLESSQISIGMQCGASYATPVGKDMSIGAEVKWSYISKIQESTIGIQFLFIYDLLDF